MSNLQGRAVAGFEPVREAFARCFEEHGDVGASVCVYVDGRSVVDLWGGVADPRSGRPWSEQTLAPVFSATKGITAVCVNQLIERGSLELDAPIARYWPEFGANGKNSITLRDVLTHRAGLAAVDGKLSLDEVYAWTPVCEAIAAQEPNWEPGTAHGYHARSYGWILGEVVRRVTGGSLGCYLAEQMAIPHALDLYIGLPAQLEPRVATLIPEPEPGDPEERALRDRLMGPDTLLGQVLSGPSNLFSYGEMWNTREMHAAELPSSNGICSARSLARMYAMLIDQVDGVRLLQPETLARAARVAVDGPDRVIMIRTSFGLGFSLPPMLGAACRAGSFGHPGAGGSLAFADPGSRMTLAYIPNRMRTGLTGDVRAQSLVEAAYACVDSSPEARAS